MKRNKKRGTKKKDLPKDAEPWERWYIVPGDVQTKGKEKVRWYEWFASILDKLPLEDTKVILSELQREFQLGLFLSFVVGFVVGGIVMFGIILLLI